MMKNFLIASLAVNGLLIVAVVLLQDMASDKATEAVVSRNNLAACAARIENIREDLESDDQIDTLPDSALTAIPDSWLFVE